MTQPFVLCKNLVKIFQIADLEVVALQGLDLEVEQGEMMALVGASGSGKSTLLNVIGGLDTPSAGEVRVAGHDLLKMDPRERVLYKRDTVGFVWQQPGRNLLPYLSAAENVELPMTLTQLSPAQQRERARSLLHLLGLSDRAHFRPDRLSGGEQQRVALAVALANNPSLLLTDEPTGQLDSRGVHEVFDALRQINQTLHTTVMVVTHDPQVAARVDRVVGIRDGRTSTEIRRERNHVDGSVQEEEWVILDQAGRMQLPQVYVDTLEMRGRVKVRLEENHVSVWPGGIGADPRQDERSVPQWRPTQTYDLQDSAVHDAEQTHPAVETHNLWRIFDVGNEQIHALRHVHLVVPTAQIVAVTGRSGSGKTTLLNLIGGLDEPTRGIVQIDGQNLAELSPQQRIELRRTQVGYVFQTFGLMPFLSARENVEVSLRLLQVPVRERHERAANVLELVGLADRANHRTHELSGGEQQRVAIARALVAQPRLLLADEPTGQLDTVTGSDIIALLCQVAHQTGVTVLVASHDPKVREAADQVYELRDGRLV